MIPVLADALRQSSRVDRARVVLACLLSAERGASCPDLWTALADVVSEYHDDLVPKPSDPRVVLALVNVPDVSAFRLARALWADEDAVWSALGREIECARMEVLQMREAVIDAARVEWPESDHA